ncbi:trypsin-like serine peptidase [Nonomuraea rhodomycinica]|uniref:V8-like Glu-specific endopeptidase n=1 Tax=Nonomuraea rhodomycinica TaxID=1712872 RepID=A0A7Y6IVE0_9ACTN|nr:hypothetical protein [Nonomuraea rhodomycinica]NUW45104.1 hypothetical protein [Nonomuraea rhodomycinica]
MKRILLPAGGAILATGLLAAGLAGTAQAQGDVATDALAKTEAQAAEVVDFWTKSNNAALTQAVAFNPDSLEVKKIKSGGGYSADTKPGSALPIGEEKKVAVKTQNVNLPKTIGKVFFEGRDGKLYWCSGTSIQSQYRNLVATAGHCVYDMAANNEVVSRWVFVPGYYQGKTPFGLYVGKQAFTHYDLDVYEDFDRDYAFVTVYNGIGGPNAGAPKQVSKADFDKFGGQKFTKDIAISEAEYTKCKDLNGGETPDCWAKPSTIQDTVGPDYPNAVKVLKEVSAEDYAKAPEGKVNGGKATGATYTEYVTESQYKGYTGPGYRKIDDKGNFTITHYFVKYWVKETAKVEYLRTEFYIVDGSLKDVGRLGDNVGGQGVAWNQPAGAVVRTFGYPAGPHPDGNKPYTGVTPKWCYGKTESKVLQIPAKKVEEHQSLRCPVTAGYDGGPWLAKYSNAKRLGYVTGVTSLIVDTDSNGRYDKITSPIFDGETAAIYKAAAAVWSGKLVK